MILLVDNYDSFTFNLWQALAGLGAEVHVLRNDALPAREMAALLPSAVVLGPGPGRPADAGEMPLLFGALPEEVPLLGVCLGHQGLVEHYGGSLGVEPEPVHGRSTLVHHDRGALFQDLPDPFPAARYHSLRAERELPPELELCAWTAAGIVMGVRHRSAPRFGVQFHPESILTPLGERLLARFLELARHDAIAHGNVDRGTRP